MIVHVAIELLYLDLILLSPLTITPCFDELRTFLHNSFVSY